MKRSIACRTDRGEGGGWKRLGTLLFCLSSCASSAPLVEAGPFHADAIVVLGHRPPLAGEAIEPELRARVEHGIAQYRAGRAPWLLFSGGPSTRRAIEADVMAQYAEQHGVPASAILRERASQDTIENARMSVELLRERLSLQRAPRVLLVTSDYHSERAARLFRCADAEVVASPAVLALSGADRAKHERSERWINVYYAVTNECQRARPRHQ